MTDMRFALLLALLAAVPCGAQDLPDPGRRLSAEEQKADPEKPRPADKTHAAQARPGGHQYDARACEGARRYYQVVCRAPDSRQSRSMDCAEAYALYRQSCP
jgi:hypothetical protein